MNRNHSFRSLATALILGACIAVAACGTTGIATPQTFTEKMAYGYSTLATVRTTTANALNAKLIKVEDAQQVQRLADEARTALDAARTLNISGDTSTALGKLNLANGILLQLQAFIPPPR